MFFLLTANPDQELASGAPRAAQEVARANYVAETFAGLAPKLVLIRVPVFALPIGGTVATMRNSCTSLSTSMRRGSASPLLPYPFRRSGRSCGYRERGRV